MVYFAPLNHLSPTKTVLLQSCRPIVSTPRRPKSILSGDKQTSLLIKLFRVLAFAGNFYLTSSCLKRQERPRARHAVAKPVPLCVNSPGRVSIHMALFGFGGSRKLFSGFFLAFLTQKSVAFDIILLLPDFSSRNLARTSLFWEVHFCEKSITYLQVRKYKYAIWLSTPPVYKYRIVKSWGRIVNEMAKRYRFNFSYFFLKAAKPVIHASFRYHLTHTLSLMICSFLKYYVFHFSFLVNLLPIEIYQRI